ncbi:pancreatic triacylglycerol lipase-like [Diabrotica virgifera virgifera]|uniref:Pancreatic triacylglycerol lipase-like n=1 Tax=Diabrotica virgifera virgifera TaxID=50390 RepID=A0A6P7EZI1_DIAVI|nr:pancreatic triacylglycerol lipase-like [Diabrotica virgifera virgifera]
MIKINEVLCIFIVNIIIHTESQESTEEVVYPINQFLLDTEKNSDGVDIFKVCDENLGCIETDSRWYHKQYRPVNLRPLPRHILKTDFLLIKKNEMNTQDLHYSSVIAKESSLREVGFKNESELMILIHDFTANGYTGWVKHLSNTILTNAMDINLISVDWQRGAEPPYDQAIANARVVALEIILLIKELQEKFRFNINNIHMVGHGVGAHICGYVGITHNTIGKITGLDPSGPRFEGMPDFVKLNPRSASYVEVIHTDYYESRSQGINETLGHSDFFINGAQKQPGCPENTSFENVLSLQRGSLQQGQVFPGCSHKRAFKYFVESLVSKKCAYQGIKCGSLEDFDNGKCTGCNSTGHNCRIFGLKRYSDSSEGNRFFLNTAPQFPFCMLEYRISVSIRDNEKYGYFTFILVDENANIAEASLTIERRDTYRLFKSQSATNNSFVYFAKPPRLNNIREAKVKWIEKKKIYCLIFCKMVISVQKVTVAFLGTGKDDEGTDLIFCPPDETVEIESGSYITFTKCADQTELSNPATESFEFKNKKESNMTLEEVTTANITKVATPKTAASLQSQSERKISTVSVSTPKPIIKFSTIFNTFTPERSKAENSRYNHSE